MGVELFFERSALSSLEEWLAGRPRKPVIIRGARQVGKSTLIRAFAERRRLSLNEINLEKHPALDRIFRTLDVQKILREFEAILGRNPATPESILFLDEIQSVPSLLPALRYFFEELPELPIIAAGSLLDFALSENKFSMPVGRIEYRYLHALTFEEFLAAIGKTNLLRYLGDYSLKNQRSQIPDAAHLDLLDSQRLYLFIGGMPEAVTAYLKREQLGESTQAQRSILDTYRDDFSKYATKRELQRLQIIFDRVPALIGGKVKYANISREETAREIKAALELLAKARIISRVHSSSCSSAPLAAQIDVNAYKILFLDVGLMNRMLDLDWRAVSELDERRLINEGPLAEQFVGQQLLAAFSQGGREDTRLFYWLREGKSSNAEVDYVVSRGIQIVPVEVKAGKAGSLKSLHQFVTEKQCPLAVRFDLNLPSLQAVEATVLRIDGKHKITYNLLSLPLYLAGQLPRLLDEIKELHP